MIASDASAVAPAKRIVPRPAAHSSASEISDVAAGILYLERATFVTGETLHIDGGEAAGH